MSNMLEKQLKATLVKIYVSGKFEGTGFFITPKGHILTAYHVLDDYAGKKIKVVSEKCGTFTNVQVFNKECRGHDLTVLKIEFDRKQIKLDCVPLSKHLPEEERFEVLGAGFPLANEDPERMKAAIYDGNFVRPSSDFKTFEVDHAIQGKGQSGGLIYDVKNRRVIGVVGQVHENIKNSGLAEPLTELFERGASDTKSLKIGLDQLVKRHTNDTGLAARLDCLFDTWEELADLTKQVAQEWDQQFPPETTNTSHLNQPDAINSKGFLQPLRRLFVKLPKKPIPIFMLVMVLLVIGIILELSNQIVIDPTPKEIIALTESAERGDIDAQTSLGEAYLEGKKVPKNYQEAKRWLEKAAEKGEPKALNLLGIMHAYGRGVPQSPSRAKELFEKANKQYYLPATLNWLKMLQEGLIPKDEKVIKDLTKRIIDSQTTGTGFIKDMSVRLFAFNSYEELKSNLEQSSSLILLDSIAYSPSIQPSQQVNVPMVAMEVTPNTTASLSESGKLNEGKTVPTFPIQTLSSADCDQAINFIEEYYQSLNNAKVEAVLNKWYKFPSKLRNSIANVEYAWIETCQLKSCSHGRRATVFVVVEVKSRKGQAERWKGNIQLIAVEDEWKIETFDGFKMIWIEAL